MRLGSKYRKGTKKLGGKYRCRCPSSYTGSSLLGYKFYSDLYHGIKNAATAAMSSGPLAGAFAFHNTVTHPEL